MAAFVRLTFVVQDRYHLLELQSSKPPEILLATPIQQFTIPDDGTFRDGPSCARVSVQSTDVDGNVYHVTRFVPQGIGRTVSCYDEGRWPDLNDTVGLIKYLEAEPFIQVSTFATVLRTLRFFEGPDAVGRQLTWAFGSPQLRVLLRNEPTGGPFYDRDSGSLQFDVYPSSRGQKLHTALSFDIVVHETTHAILDGIAPDLYHATRTESLALHEAIADLSAIFLTVLNEMVLFSLVNLSSSQMDIASALGKLGEELGHEMRGALGLDFVRALHNPRTLDPYYMDLSDPYAVSEVLSGAVFQTFVNCANGLRLGEPTLQNIRWTNEKQILKAGKKITRMLFRALDYLPPGEVSLADFGRAMIAADRVLHSRSGAEINWLIYELKKRRIVNDNEELLRNSDFVGTTLNGMDHETLYKNLEAAEYFARQNRELLQIPQGTAFDVLPCRMRIRKPAVNRSQDAKKDLIFRVGWDMQENHDLGSRLTSQWHYRAGTTLVMDSDTGEILSVLSTDPDRQYADRDQTLKAWARDGKLLLTENMPLENSESTRDKIIVENRNGLMRAHNSVRALCS